MKITDLAKSVGVQGGHPPLLAGEAHALWRFLTLRYIYLEFTQILNNYVTDSDFKVGILRGLSTTMADQINKIEHLMDSLGIPLPPKPPKSVNTAVKSEAFRDETIYRLLLIGIEYFHETHVETLRMMNDDKLRNTFMGWLGEEMKIFDSMVKYGKLKGWYWNAPQYKH